MIIMARYDPVVPVSIAFSVSLVLFCSPSARLPSCLALPLRRCLGLSVALGSAELCLSIFKG